MGVSVFHALSMAVWSLGWRVGKSCKVNEEMAHQKTVLFPGGSLAPPSLPGRVKSPQREGNKEEREGRVGSCLFSHGRVLLFHPAILGLPRLPMYPS